MSEISVSYYEGLMHRLNDPEQATAYLNAALEDGDQDVFLLALRDVAEARGMTKLAQDAQLNRENLYRMLSRQGNPQLTSLIALLKGMGLRLSIAVETTPQ